MQLNDQTWSDEGNQSSVSSVSTTSATRGSQRKDCSPSASSSSLFAEEPEDLFSGSVGKSAARGGGTGGVLAGGTGGALSSGGGGGGLFGDDEDLFGSSSKPQVAAPVGARARKSGLLFDEEDDERGDFLSGAEVKSARKQPEGGKIEVESDLFGSTRTTQALDPKPTEVKSQAPVTPRKATLSLFDDNNDDDLFGITSPLAKSNTGQKSTEVQSRASHKSHLQDDDWLFGGGDDTDPTVDLFGPKKPSKTKEILNKAPPPVATEGATNKSSNGGEIEPSIAEAKKTIQEETDSVPVKPKKMAGAVSMFGSIDPSKVGQTRSAGRPPITKKPTSPKQPEDNFDDQTDKQFTKSSSEGATVKPSVFSLPATKSNMEPPVGKSQTSPDIRTKQANLSLDPSALLPGASGPRKRVETGRAVEGAASFDEPVQTPVLQSVSKDRARVQVKRRPPTRKSRLTVNTDTNSQDLPDTTEVIDRGVDPGHTPYTAPTDDSLFSPRKDNKLTTSKKGQNRDLFSDDSDDLLAVAENIITGTNTKPGGGGLSDNDDVVTGASVVTSIRSTSKTKATECLFGDNDFIHPQVSKVSQSEHSNVDQLPQSLTSEIAAKHSSSSSDELFPSSKRGDAKKSTIKRTSDLFEDNDNVDDIFGVEKKTTISSSMTLPEDDMFGSSFTNTSKSKIRNNDGLQPTSNSVSAVAPPGDNEIDDIFADSTMNVKKGRKAPDRQDTQRKLPADDEDDIFGASSRPSVRHHPRKAVTRDEDIFADDTDIFADLPSGKPKSKKTKAKTSTGQTKSLFSTNDVDDIFADVPSKPKPRVKKSPTPAKAAAAPKGASIFDDDSPSIFDDPLNALGK